MFILVTGASGQLGRSIKSLVEKNKINHSFIFISRDQLDLSCLKSIQSYFKDHKFDLIINCAAYTAVDKAEESNLYYTSEITTLRSRIDIRNNELTQQK